MKEIDINQADTSRGDGFRFHDVCLWLHRDAASDYRVTVWHPVLMKQSDPRAVRIFLRNTIANFSFTEMNEALEMTNYILCKIAVADALLGWISQE